MDINEKDRIVSVESHLRLWAELMADAATGDSDREIVFDGLAQRLREDADELSSLIAG